MPIKIIIAKAEIIGRIKFCSICKKSKSINEFDVCRNSYDGFQGYCKLCRIEYNKQWRANNPDWREYRRNHRKLHKEQISIHDKNKRLKLKQEFMKEYGGVCICCGESNICFLSIDHIDGKGKEHRLKLGISKRGGSTSNVLRDIRKRGWPKDNYRILCYNCNIARAQNNGICPHEEERLKLYAS